MTNGKPLLQLLAAFALSLGFIGNSIATPINVNFQLTPGSTNQLLNSLHYDINGLKLDITPQALDGTNIVASQIFQNEYGLGIKLTAGRDGSEIDNSGPDEMLTLAFSKDVNLVSASFNQLGTNDDIIVASTNNTLSHIFTQGNSSDSGIENLLLPSLTGKIFTFSPISSNSEYSLASISFSSQNNTQTLSTAPQAQPIPSPGTPALLLAGLALLFNRKR
jgi:hypothetical protein